MNDRNKNKCHIKLEKKTHLPRKILLCEPSLEPLMLWPMENLFQMGINKMVFLSLFSKQMAL